MIACWICSLAVVLGLGESTTLAQTETILHRFQSSSGVDGANPSSGVFLGKRGTLYGTTLAGGRDNDGVVFQLSPPTSQGGPWNEEVLYGFSGGDRGALPSGNLLIDTNGGKIFGTTIFAASYGSVFEVMPPTHGSAWQGSLLHSFTGGVDGGEPGWGVIPDSHGQLYGNAPYGGKEKNGVVFQLTPPSQPGSAWTEEVLHGFLGGTDGALPRSALVFDSSSALYGTTVVGGNGCGTGCGTVFKMTPPTSTGGGWVAALSLS